MSDCCRSCFGDRQENFTIQSISKVFVYGMALEDGDRQTLLIDERGNSVRGIKVFEALADKFNLHLFDRPLAKCSFLDISETQT